MSTLHIIGNGFDLAHKLPTSYWDYYQFLKQNGEGWFVNMMENYFDHRPSLYNHHKQPLNTLWSDLEAALGEYSVDGIYKFLCEGHEFDIDHPNLQSDAIEAELEHHFVKTKEQFQETFTDWCKSINVKTATKRQFKHFDPNGLFLTFNYSDTLEQVYGIPSAQILHIHGRSANHNERLIIGHNNPANMPNNIKDDFVNHHKNYKDIVDTINDLKKDQSSIIQRHNKFFARLSTIDKVVVYGHSMADVDRPYFDAVKAHVHPDALWHLSYYCDNERFSKYRLAKQLGLKMKGVPVFRM